MHGGAALLLLALLRYLRQRGRHARARALRGLDKARRPSCGFSSGSFSDPSFLAGSHGSEPAGDSRPCPTVASTAGRPEEGYCFPLAPPGNRTPGGTPNLGSRRSTNTPSGSGRGGSGRSDPLGSPSAARPGPGVGGGPAKRGAPPCLPSMPEAAHLSSCPEASAHTAGQLEDWVSRTGSPRGLPIPARRAAAQQAPAPMTPTAATFAGAGVGLSR